MRHPVFSVLLAFTFPLAAGYAADTAPSAPVPSAAMPAPAPAPPAVPGVQKSVFGTTADGTEVDMYTLTNHHGFTAKIITYGATIAALDVPDRDGKTVSVVKGAATLAAYLRGFSNPAAASIMGRVANRISGAKFTLDGKEYVLADNAGGNSIHGGKVGYDKKVWTAEVPDSPDGPAVKLTYVSKDGEEGFPGTLTSSLTYTMTETNALRLGYVSTTDKPTLVNLLSHAYFNLAGTGDISAHEVMINADLQTIMGPNGLVTGEIGPVKDTPVDFRTAITMSKAAARLAPGGRFDHSFIINRAQGDTGMALAASVYDPASGRSMEVWTTQPGVQLYTIQFGAAPGRGRGGRGPGGAGGHANDFYCFETQHFPDAIHHENFPSIVLRPGETAASTTEYRFSVRPAAAVTAN